MKFVPVNMFLLLLGIFTLATLASAEQTSCPDTSFAQRLANLLAVMKAKQEGGLGGLSRIVLAQPGAWSLANPNVALPSLTSEYYVDAIAEGEEVTVTITHPGAGAIYVSVASYNNDNGNPIINADGSHDQIVPLEGESLSKTWKGPLQLLVRYYRSDWLRGETAASLGWLPTMYSETEQHYIADTCPEHRKKLSDALSGALEEAVMKTAPEGRLNVSTSNVFEVSNGQGLYPNPQSKYSYYTPDLEGKAGVKITMSWPAVEAKQLDSLLFGDIMCVDMLSTRTDDSIPSDSMTSDGSTPWGEEFMVYVYKHDVPLPADVVAAVAAKKVSLLRWHKDTSVPGLVYRIVHGVSESGGEEDRINVLLRTPKIELV